MSASLTAGNTRALAAAGLCAVALTGCIKPSAPIAAASASDQVVARVDGGVVWASDVQREAAAQGLVSEPVRLAPTSVGFHAVLDQIVDRRLLAAEALRQGLDKAAAAQRRLAAARERVLADLILEHDVRGALTDKAVTGLYDVMIQGRAVGANPPTLAELRPRIVRFLTFDRVKDEVLDLRRRARIESLTPKPAVAQNQAAS